MNLYKKKDGWIDVESIIKAGYVFNFITGGRGIGKTYGFILFFVLNKIPFILMRRTEKEAEIEADPKTSSVSKVLADLDIPCRSRVHGKTLRSLYRTDTDQEICTVVGLSTFASFRGINLSSYDYILYDEFITEPHVRALKREGHALSSAYETINRNRELLGQDPVRLFALSNSLNIANDIFIEFGLVSAAEQLTMNHEEIYIRDRTLLLVLQNSPVSKKKKQTALYSAGSEEYARMAISNEFIANDFRYVKKQPLNEYIAEWSVGDLYVYRHKTRDEWYITFKAAQLPKSSRYGSNYMDLERMKRDKLRFWWSYLDGYVKFDSYNAVALFEKYFK